MPTQTSISLPRFWLPWYWHVWIFFAWLRTVGPLPLRRKVALGKRLGRVLCPLFRGKCRTVRANFEVCFPELSPRERETLCRRHYESVGIGLTELATSWFGVPERLRETVRIEGREHLEEALEKGKGVLFFCGHFTPMELIHAVMRPLCPRVTAMYRPMRNELLDRIILRGRGRHIDELISKYSVKTLLRRLSENSVVFYLADQSSRDKYSAPVPFFGLPAMTNTAVSRILRISGATLLPLYFRRLEDGSGYVASIDPPLPDLPSNDPVADTTRLMRALEDYIRTCPEQYTWMHRRFKDLPDGYPDVYN